jgi:hypothetical protein
VATNASAQDQTANGQLCGPETPVESGRRSPQIPVLEYEPTPCDPTRLPPTRASAIEASMPLPDRWRVVSLLGMPENPYDPYGGNNWIKGDRPVFGEDGFFVFTGVSDTVIEPRRFPVPVNAVVSERAGSNDTFGDGEQFFASQTFLLETIFYIGDTVFKPPDWEFRFTPAFNVNYASVGERGLLKANPDFGTSRTEGVIGIQALFVDKHLRNVSTRYDFDSLRVGIQPFTSDFRGFLFLDNPFGVRLFGTRANNRIQYNLAWFRRLEKDTNSGLTNVLELGDEAFRDDDLFTANLYFQDWPMPGFTVQGSITYERNREGSDVFYDDNGFIQRPASIGLERGYDYDVTWLGFSGDGHLGAYNLTFSAYAAIGDAERGTFVDTEQDVRAGFFAAEVSRDYSWVRLRGSFAYASGDDDPFDDLASGFDAIFENPLFAGADTSFWIREPVPLIGGGRVTLSGRNGMLNSLRPSKDFGQANFANPGLVLVGLGADFDLAPEWRVTGNANWIGFADTAVLEVARAQAPIATSLGVDLSLAVTWRPFATQNVIARLSMATMLPGPAYRELYVDEPAYAVLGNMVLTF